MDVGTHDDVPGVDRFDIGTPSSLGSDWARISAPVTPDMIHINTPDAYTTVQTPEENFFMPVLPPTVEAVERLLEAGDKKATIVYVSENQERYVDFSPHLVVPDLLEVEDVDPDLPDWGIVPDDPPGPPPHRQPLPKSAGATPPVTAAVRPAEWLGLNSADETSPGQFGSCFGTG